MSLASTIRAHLIDRLVPVFGKPQNADGLAEALAARCDPNVAPEALDALVGRIVEGRKAKGFPSAAELIALVKALPVAGGGAAPGTRKYVTQAERTAAAMAAEAAEKRAIAMLHGTDIAARAVAEGWARCLVEFAAAHGREPTWGEERDIIAPCRRNDVDAEALRDAANGPFAAVAHSVWRLRGEMHARAARDLGFADALPPGPVSGRVRQGREVSIAPVDPASLAPSDELIGRL